MPEFKQSLDDKVETIRESTLTNTREIEGLKIRIDKLEKRIGELTQDMSNVGKKITKVPEGQWPTAKQVETCKKFGIKIDLDDNGHSMLSKDQVSGLIGDSWRKSQLSQIGDKKI